MKSGRSPRPNLDATDKPSSLASERTVIVVGAGLAGLSSAYELARKGYRVTILEARDRVGGRIETFREPFTDGFFVEAGAYWVNDRHTVVMGYIKELGLKSMLVEVPLEKHFLLCHIRNTGVQARLKSLDNWPDKLGLLPIEKNMGLGGILWSIFGDEQIGDPRDPGWPPDAVKSRYGAMNFLEFLKSPHEIRNPKTGPVSEYKPSPGAIELIRPWFAWWDDLDQLSALAMIQYAVTGQRLCEPLKNPSKWFRTKNGMDSFPRELEKKLTRLGVTIHKNADVFAIEHMQDGVKAKYRSASGDGVEIAGHLVCAIPLTTLKNVTVTPNFSESKRSLIEGVRYASVSRAYIQCRQRIEDMKNGAGYTDLPIGNLLDMSFKLKNGPGRVLQGFMIGKQAKLFATMDDKEKRAFTLRQLRVVFPQLNESDVEHFAFKCWDDDRWSLGAYPVYTPQQFLSRQELVKCEGRIHFAGEHTSEHSAWMEGALRSGNRAASEIDPSIKLRT